MFDKYKFKKICKRIKEVKIQGATNVAKAALKAYFLYPSKVTKRILLNLRPTEPMLSHVLQLADKEPEAKILNHFKESQERINKNVFKIIKNNSIIFTHCHSTNVVKALIYSKKKGKNFQVYNTETRPLYQGRKTARELTAAGIKVTDFIDSAAKIAIEKSNVIFLGADALLKNAVINKVGSGMIAQIAHDKKIPVYIIADSWKYSTRDVKLEERDFKEVWNPKKNPVHVENPAFESINIKNVKLIVSELGIMSYERFLKSVNK
jgi:translation initiation factor 2B subunit (eIF-2B alpha/beta/delta family)